MANVAVGKLDRKIALKVITYTTGTAGHAVPSTTTISNVWANVEWSSGDEKERAGRQEMQTKVIFTIRHFPALTNKYFIVYESDTYDIENIQEVGRRQYTKITTELRQ